MLMANSAAILTDVFPDNQRGMALGVNQAAAFSGTFIGLVLGGLLAPINWRLIFLVSVPIGLFATVLGYSQAARDEPRAAGPHRLAGQHHLRRRAHPGHGGHHLRHRALRPPRHGLDQPDGASARSSVGVALLIAFCIIETKVAQPMFRLQLFKIRAFTSGVLASFLAALSRGGLMFMLIIWLQGIWLPLHGYDFSVTPLWAGIAMLPLTLGFLIAGPVSGILSDRYGARPFATGGMLGTAVCFALLELLPVDFPYWVFAVLLFLTGLTMASFGSPNRAGVMNSLPPQHRGAGSGMNTTFQNSAQVLSIGIFFTLMIVGLTSSLPGQPAPRAGRPRRADRRGRPGRPPAAGLHPVRRLPRLRPGPAPDRRPRPEPAAAGPAARAHRPQLLPRSDQRRRSGPGCTPPSTSPSWPACWPPAPRGCAGGRYVYSEPEQGHAEAGPSAQDDVR